MPRNPAESGSNPKISEPDLEYPITNFDSSVSVARFSEAESQNFSLSQTHAAQRGSRGKMFKKSAKPAFEQGIVGVVVFSGVANKRSRGICTSSEPIMSRPMTTFAPACLPPKDRTERRLESAAWRAR